MKKDSRRAVGQEGIEMEVLSKIGKGKKKVLKISVKEIQQMMGGDQTSACLGEQ